MYFVCGYSECISYNVHIHVNCRGSIQRFIVIVHYIHYRFNMAKSCIFHELIELSRDEETSVRIASLETLVDLLDFFEKSKSSIIQAL